MSRLLTLFVVLVSVSVNSYAWTPAGDSLKTRWAADVDPGNPLPEYPRPQMVRDRWLSLNGLWDYSITGQEDYFSAPDGRILVPFCPESSLSGVQKTVPADHILWYKREFTIPREWKHRDVILHFGAVDWSSEVWLNGHKIGEHKGGYSSFEFNVTLYLKKSGKQELLVKVMDATDASYQPRGKQWRNPQRVWYTSVTGIWQTVWLEPVSNEAHITSYYPETAGDSLKIKVLCDGILPDDIVKVDVFQGGVGITSDDNHPEDVVASAYGDDVCFDASGMERWSPDKPYLYGLKISLIRNGKVLDSIRGYAAVRQITKALYPEYDMNVNSYMRFHLNGQPVFMFGLLDQGWWPDGLYTAPTDEALKYDIIKTKELGFNTIRKHVKVESARWYYWCDVLGVFVWQDMPNAGDRRAKPYLDGETHSNLKNVWAKDTFAEGTECVFPEKWKAYFLNEWGEIIDALKQFQCIVSWVPFNEAWGQFDTGEVVGFTHSKDASRLVNEASGGNHHFNGDIIDNHHYSCPAMNAFDARFINVVGEYGGLIYKVKGHLWKPQQWDESPGKETAEDVIALYAKFAEDLKLLIKAGCAGAIYTQTTDVEGELNGLMTYDRTDKFDTAKIRDINLSVIKSAE